MSVPYDSHFIPAFTIEEVILDKDTGAPLSGGVVTFEEALQPGVLKAVWQITNTSGVYTFTQLPNPMTLSAIGTFEDSIGNPVIPYFFPYDGDGNVDYYRVIVESSGGVEQFVREPVPYVAAGGGSSIANTFDNEISNPQFAEVYFDTVPATKVYSFNAASNQVVTIAPNWDIIVSSAAAATVTVSQVRPAGSVNRITNPGTLLNINSSGVSNLRLRQRIFGSPNLWGSGYISASFIAKTYSGTSPTLQMNYSQSNGSVANIPLVTASLAADGTYGSFTGSVLIGASGSLDTYPTAYIDIEFIIPESTQIDISSVMLVSTGLTPVPAIVYDQASNYRQLDHLFHDYKPGLVFKPIPSLLTGWDFPLNPRQFGTVTPVTTTAGYFLDQTIMGSATGNIAVSANGATNGLSLVNASASEAVYLLQYLTAPEARKILASKWSVNLQSWCNQNDVQARVYLYRGSSAAIFPNILVGTTIGTIANTGEFTLTAANWTLINRGTFTQAQGSVAQSLVNSDLNKANIDLGFHGWQVVDNTEIGDTNKFAIVVTYQLPTASTTLNIDSISLVPGDIPTRPAPQSREAVLLDCQPYFEGSFGVGVAPGTAATSGFPTFPMPTMQITSGGSSPATKVGSGSFTIDYKAPKKTASPVVTIFNDQSGVANNVNVALYYNGSLIANSAVTFNSNWGVLTSGSKFISYVSNNGTFLQTTAAVFLMSSGYMSCQYTIDSRLGTF